MRHGIKTIIIPDKNKKDLEDIPEEFRNKLNFVPVRTFDEVLDTALTEKVLRLEDGAGGASTKSGLRSGGKHKKSASSRNPGFDKVA